MSMLSPLGTVDRQRRWARAIARIVIVLLLLGILAGAGYASWHYLVQKTPSATPSRSGCPKTSTTPGPVRPTTQPPPLAAAKITLNIYNATTRTGLASTVAAQLRARKFKVVSVSNDPLNKKLTGFAEVRSGPRGAGAARTVAAQVAGPVVLVPDKRADFSVDLVLGARWRTVATGAQVAANLRAKPKPLPIASSKSTTKC